MNLPILSVLVVRESDVVLARRRARQIAEVLGFDSQDQTRIATSVSEVARNAFVYAGSGTVEFLLQRDAPRALVVRVSDRGPGIADLNQVLSGRYKSSTGMGTGLIGTRRLMDSFSVESEPGNGTSVTFSKNVPNNVPAFSPSRIKSLAERVAQAPQGYAEEVRQQNQELLNAMAVLQERQEELSRLNRELEDTNRGVVALYAELDERAERLRYADQMKSRFLSHMSHEFRTPLNGIVGLTRLLLRRAEVTASPELTREIQFIQRSAQELSELVNDLLDLAKVEAGKLTVQVSKFTVREVFGALRTLMRPLLTNDSVEFLIEDNEIPELLTDENKVAQIVRNFVSNALKFTDRGQVRVGAVLDPNDDSVHFYVSDTGIGIAPEHLKRIFEEFSQIDSPAQRRVKGTGLGLPLCKRLAELLGGQVLVESTPGAGSTFTAVIPRVHPSAVTAPPESVSGRAVLLIDDEEVSRYLLRQLLGPDPGYEILEAVNGMEGLELIAKRRPDLVFLDITMPGMSGVEVLTRLHEDPATRELPVVIVTGQPLDETMRQSLANNALLVLSKDVLAGAEALSIAFGPPVAVQPRFL